MDKKMFVIEENFPIKEAMKMIRKNAKGFVVAIDKKGIVKGVLTDGDIRKALITDKTVESKIKDAMQKDFISETTDTPETEILSKLNTQIKFIPILNPDKTLNKILHIDNYYEYQMRTEFVPIFKPYLAGNEKKYLMECIDTGWISSQGSFVKRFESCFANYIGTKYAASASNCTTALHLALVALDIGPGDEVLCPNLTFIAPANMISLTGAKVVLVDSEKETWAMSPELIKKAITPKTKAILLVHPFGHCAKMDEIAKICKKHNLYLIEDVAEAIGGKYKGQMLGTFGDIACYSFFGNKVITSGEGGMIVTNNEKLWIKCEELRDHGMAKEKKYYYKYKGYNYRMTNMQAAIGLAQLEEIETILKIRSRQNAFYRECLGNTAHYYSRPIQSWCSYIPWLTTITLKKKDTRDKLIEYLKSQGVDARQMVLPISGSYPYRAIAKGKFPVSCEISYNSLHLPSSTGLSEEQIIYIVEKVRKGIQHIG
ncbi:MAG: aminotransferase class I/II-fold pyridoxal phosphate-dependent enzyme [Candidatus Omnitrophica bacterium]|nr:aminotransferase class I/II-fold pyridoxal phosphate-dependent enzyme [Candidatus Omnitrophota bacterium]